MSASVSLGEILLGIEGLALLRLAAADGDPSDRMARVEEMRSLLERVGDPRELARPAYGSDGDYFSKPNREQIFEIAYEIMRESYPKRFPRFI